MARLRSILFATALFASGVLSTHNDPLTLAIRQEPQNTDSVLSSMVPRPTPSADQSTPARAAAEGDPTSTRDTPESQRTSSTASPVSSKLSPDATTSVSVKKTTALPPPSPAPSPPSAENDKEPDLPLQPVVNPAFGVAGVILMISGALYAFIGIRCNPLYVFLSAAYLVALAIVVLIVYLIHPPISLAVQGAFLVAAVVPACAIGGISLIFRDLTACLGCLLGGFCLGMWFLVLKDGGLVESTGGRVGIIAGFAVAGLSLSFSQHTRNYGLIACMSFAGATATVLGIDCFSRAGLKEFWLYLWDLNSEIFPHGTTTYPVTKGIKAEIACIIIIMAFGCVSQLKLWKTIRERRNRKGDAAMQREEERERLEAENGRAVQAQNDQGLAQWEAVYGDKANKNGFSASTVTESTPDSNQDSGYHSHGRSLGDASSNTPKAANDDDVELANLGSGSVRTRKASSRTSGDASFMSRANSDAKSYVTGDDSGDRPWHDADAPPVPPLPFKVPAGENANESQGIDKEDARSQATAGDSVDDEVVPMGSSRNATGSHRKLRMTRDFASAEEDDKHDPTIPHLDSRRSSVAATLDGLSEDGDRGLPDLSRSGTPQPLSETPKTTSTGHVPRRSLSASSIGNVLARSHISTNTASVDPSQRHSLQPSGTIPDSELGALASLSDRPDAAVANLDPLNVKRLSGGGRSAVSSSNNTSEPQVLTKDALPDGQSSTVSLYRTNEWAKNAAIAERPSAESLASAADRGLAIDYNREPAARVDVQQLQQTAFSSQPPVVSRKASAASFSSAAPIPALGRVTSTSGVPVYSHSPVNGTRQSSVQRSSSGLAPTKSASGSLPPQQSDQRLSTNKSRGRHEDLARNRTFNTSKTTHQALTRSTSGQQQARSLSNPIFPQNTNDPSHNRQHSPNPQSTSQSPHLMSPPLTSSPQPQPQRYANAKFRRHSTNLSPQPSSTSLASPTTATPATQPPQVTRTTSLSSSYAPANPSRLSQVQNAQTRAPTYRGQSSPHLLLPQHQNQNLSQYYYQQHQQQQNPHMAHPLKRSTSAQYSSHQPYQTLRSASPFVMTQPQLQQQPSLTSLHQPTRRNSSTNVNPDNSATQDTRLASWRMSGGAYMGAGHDGAGHNARLEEAHRRGLRRLQSLAE